MAIDGNQKKAPAPVLISCTVQMTEESKKEQKELMLARLQHLKNLLAQNKKKMKIIKM